MYRTWQEPKKSGGHRVIEAPREDLKLIQKRIAELLQRVSPPSFLFSPVRGKSYIDNALIHEKLQSLYLLDVSNYFGNCLAKSVYRFFHKDLRCSPDVAHLLTGLTTKDGHLPQGSPCSPILSFYSSIDMWNEITYLAKQENCTVSLYVDDVTISGKVVPERLKYAIKGVLHKFGHEFSRPKEGTAHRRPTEVTGIIVGAGKARVPHRHYKKLLQARQDARIAETEDERSRAQSRARSLEHQVVSLQTKRSKD